MVEKMQPFAGTLSSSAITNNPFPSSPSFQFLDYQVQRLLFPAAPKQGVISIVFLLMPGSRLGPRSTEFGDAQGHYSFLQEINLLFCDASLFGILYALFKGQFFVPYYSTCRDQASWDALIHGTGAISTRGLYFRQRQVYRGGFIVLCLLRQQPKKTLWLEKWKVQGRRARRWKLTRRMSLRKKASSRRDLLERLEAAREIDSPPLSLHDASLNHAQCTPFNYIAIAGPRGPNSERDCIEPPLTTLDSSLSNYITRARPRS
jgi:hypothetical protein